MAKQDLYFILNPGLGIIKIGVTRDIDQRVRSLEHTCGVPLVLLRVVEGGGDYEESLHQAFGRDRLLGEWFCPTNALVQLSTGNEAIDVFLVRVQPATEEWLRERAADMTRLRAEREAAAAEERAEEARIAAEEARLRKQREERAAKRRETMQRKRKEQEEAERKRIQGAWSVREVEKLERFTSADARQLADQRRKQFAQRLRNATLIGTTAVDVERIAQ